MTSEHKGLVIVAFLLAIVVLTLSITLTLNDMNYDNKRMQYGYCETLLPGTTQRLLVKCGGSR